MVQSKNASTGGTGWNTQAYVLVTICLVVGIAIGYLLRGSSTAAAVPEQTASSAAATPNMGSEQVTPEQLKHMADKQAEPILAQLKSSPNDPKLLSDAGNIYYDAKLFKDAVDYYGRSLSIDPQNASVRTDMGTAYFYLGDVDRAIKEFETALKTDPKHAQTMFNLGMVQWQGKGDALAAVAAWEKLLKVAPDYPERAKVEQMIVEAKKHASKKVGTKTDKPATM